MTSDQPVEFPSPTIPATSRTEVFVRYLDFYRERLIDKLGSLPSAEQRASRLPSGWTPIELVKHLRWVELRWLEWGFEGRAVDDPWADTEGDRWYVADDETMAGLVAELRTQGERTRAIIEANSLSAVGQPGERWSGAEPATLERICFHLLQEYARHVGHADIVSEIITGQSGE